MPSVEFGVLSEREEQYLEEPDQFGSQERAEIRYRLRAKYEKALEAVTRLEERPETWDTKERAGDGIVTCSECGARRTFPRYAYRETGETTVRTIGSWHMITRPPGPNFIIDEQHPYRGYCDSCWNELRDREAVVEQGRVLCSKPGCNTHRVGSTPYRECKEQGLLVFSDEDLDELEDEYRERRHSVCPDCGTPRDDLSEGEIEVLGYVGPGGLDGATEMTITEGLICSCGWEGFHYDLRHAKK